MTPTSVQLLRSYTCILKNPSRITLLVNATFAERARLSLQVPYRINIRGAEREGAHTLKPYTPAGRAKHLLAQHGGSMVVRHFDKSSGLACQVA